MPRPSLQEASRERFTCKGERGTFQEIQTGAIQRIADATEAMAHNHNRLLRDNGYLRERVEELNSRIEKRDYQIASLRGWITRLRNAAKKGD